ncbi:MAG: L-serine ammonia-lyase, iron-sulfur-dependent subunit beta [Tissierellia bacterium]|nr:L-serine ammonia-lyase, iron-sulfur-dependent subunit beta [Tissierellia bacterium]
MKDFSLLEVLGPIMIGPSSSHTAGAARLGRMGSKIAGPNFYKVVFELHGSFAKTYAGHGTDKALLAGVMGFTPSDERIRDSYALAVESGLEFEFVEVDLGYVHPNTVRMQFMYKDQETFYVQGSSIGGGNIIITDINGTEIEYRGERPTIIAKYVDKRGILSKITSLFSISGINIANMSVIRNRKIATLVCELEGEVDNSIVDDINRLYTFDFIKFISPGKEDDAYVQ